MRRMVDLIAGRQKILDRDLLNSLISIYIVNCSTAVLLWKVCQGLLLGLCLAGWFSFCGFVCLFVWCFI